MDARRLGEFERAAVDRGRAGVGIGRGAGELEAACAGFGEGSIADNRVDDEFGGGGPVLDLEVAGAASEREVAIDGRGGGSRAIVGDIPIKSER